MKNTAENFPLLSTTRGFFKHRNFDILGEPLLITAERSKLTPASEEKILSLEGSYLVSIKKDGKFIRVIKRGNIIRMITSGHKDFYHNALALQIASLPDGQYNMELVYKDGVLKSRNKTGFLTTAYTLYDKKDPSCGVWLGQEDIRFEIFDYLAPEYGGEGNDHPNPVGLRYSAPYHARIGNTRRLITQERSEGSCLSAVDSVVVRDLASCPSIVEMNQLLKETLGYDPDIHEGLVFQGISEPYTLPLNHNAFKLKNVKELVGVVTNVELDKHGGNGTLVLRVEDRKQRGSKSSRGLFCRVSSGITGEIRAMSYRELMGTVVEVEYESFTADGEYNLPRIKRFGV